MKPQEIRQKLTAARKLTSSAGGKLSVLLTRRLPTPQELSKALTDLRLASLYVGSCLAAVDPDEYDHLTREDRNPEYWKELGQLGKQGRLPESHWPKQGE